MAAAIAKIEENYRDRILIVRQIKVKDARKFLSLTFSQLLEGAGCRELRRLRHSALLINHQKRCWWPVGSLLLLLAFSFVRFFTLLGSSAHLALLSLWSTTLLGLAFRSLCVGHARGCCLLFYWLLTRYLWGFLRSHLSTKRWLICLCIVISNSGGISCLRLDLGQLRLLLPLILRLQVVTRQGSQESSHPLQQTLRLRWQNLFSQILMIFITASNDSFKICQVTT